MNFVPTSEDGHTGQIEMEASGLWVETILWEVPLMAILSETYFQIDDTDWTYDDQKGASLKKFTESFTDEPVLPSDLAFDKGQELLEAGCFFSDFGTRRRRSFRTQDLVVQGLILAVEKNSNTGGRFSGTSNVSNGAFCLLRLQATFLGPSRTQIRPYSNRHHSSVSCSISTIARARS